MIHLLTLLGRNHELDVRIRADRHVVEVPDEQRAPVDELVDVLGARDRLVVFGGVAAGDAEGQAVLLEQVHAVLDLVVHAVADAHAAAEVGGLLAAFLANGRDEVLHAQQVLAELLVDERCVGEAQEDAVVVLLAQPDEVVLADQRLAARVDVHVDAKLFALLDDGVDVLVAQVEPVAVVGSPAALAVQVAGAGRVEQDCPGDVALVLGTQLVLLCPALDVDAEVEVHQDVVEHVRIELVERAHDELVDVLVRAGHIFVDNLELRGEQFFANHVDNLEKARDCLFGVRVEHLENRLDTQIGKFFLDHNYTSSSVR